VTPMRILLADSQPKVRFALRVLLEHQSGLEIVGEATDTQALFKALQTLDPDIVLLDWELPGLKEAVSLPDLRQTKPGIHVIVLGGRPSARKPATGAGADAFVSKGDSPERLLAAIRACQPTP
jgi:DNA-binding NarL/FixJ family response regulator